MKKLLEKLMPESMKKDPETPAGTIAFKNNAWKSKASAKTYSRHVEHVFFDNITAVLFTENIEPGSRVLDVGAGTGRLSFALADNGCTVVASDISKEMLSHIEKDKGGRRITTLESGAKSLPLESESFDAVVSMDFLLHFPDWASLLEEQARLCRFGGVVMFNFLSSENTRLLESNRKGSESVGNFFASGFAASASRKEIEEVASRIGLRVEAIYPYDFFSFNSMFGHTLTKNEVHEFYWRFIGALEKPEVLQFVKDFEESIVRRMPISNSVTMVVKLKKV